ncbi:hypothetical protein E3J59_01270 [Candidatus Aerophobetes bacterium]|uniref:Outer membrane protein beta-barrel domain-containing protein n=1 Tax=Aerophobetes bacterium TaxID=2030807 RepID=A0A523UZQ0_UNCAE|nr:MAG: hypothetical protein E3J59_01270 [Candidatus Aerophobetes bacterium]
MKKLCVGAIVVGLAVLVLASSAIAMDMKGKFGFDVQIGYAMMDIKGVNEGLDFHDENGELLGWTTESKDYLKGGMTYVGEAKYGITSSLLLTASGGLLSSKGKVTSTGPTDFTFDDKVSATFFGGGALFVLPLGGENLNLLLGGGADYYRVKYEDDFTENGTERARRAEGSKVGFHLRGGMEYFLTPNIAISGKIIYRIVKLSEIETTKDDWGISAEGDPLEVYTEPIWSGLKKLEIDLGGINAYVNICLYFG